MKNYKISLCSSSQYAALLVERSLNRQSRSSNNKILSISGLTVLFCVWAPPLSLTQQCGYDTLITPNPI